MEDVIIRYRALPSNVNGLTITDSEGDYNVYISSHLSYEKARQVLCHELSHIKLNHFYQPEKPLRQIEMEADKHAAILLSEKIIVDQEKPS